MNDYFHVFEAFDPAEIYKFIRDKQPDAWFTETRVNIDDLRTIYVLNWIKKEENHEH